MPLFPESPGTCMLSEMSLVWDRVQAESWAVLLARLAKPAVSQCQHVTPHTALPSPYTPFPRPNLAPSSASHTFPWSPWSGPWRTNSSIFSASHRTSPHLLALRTWLNSFPAVAPSFMSISLLGQPPCWPQAPPLTVPAICPLPTHQASCHRLGLFGIPPGILTS